MNVNSIFCNGKKSKKIIATIFRKYLPVCHTKSVPKDRNNKQIIICDSKTCNIAKNCGFYHDPTHIHERISGGDF